MVKHTQTIYQLLPTDYLSVFDHYVGLAVKGLMCFGYREVLKKLILFRAFLFNCLALSIRASAALIFKTLEN